MLRPRNGGLTLDLGVVGFNRYSYLINEINLDLFILNSYHMTVTKFIEICQSCTTSPLLVKDSGVYCIMQFKNRCI